MHKTFLLTGKPRAGKTTAIKQIASKLGLELCGGFYTEEMRDASDRVGFRCVTLTGESKEIAHVNSKSAVRVGRYGVDIGSFESIALPAVQNSLELKKVTVIDEIGFMQMLSVPFQRMIYRIVSDADRIVLGTVCLDSHPVIDNIKKLPGVSIYTLNEENRDFVTEVAANDILKAVKS